MRKFVNDVLKDEKVLITEGGTGIGESLGARFIELGAEIVICARPEKVLKTSVQAGTDMHPLAVA
jgi:short-subunit dehydrogenase involved in D-alanine esterification of teichoic acids